MTVLFAERAPRFLVCYSFPFTYSLLAQEALLLSASARRVSPAKGTCLPLRAMASAAGSGQLQSREEGERDLDCPSFAEREAPPRRGWRVKQRSALRASETSAQCFSANWSNSVQQVKSKAPKTEDQSLQEETKRLCAKTPWCLGFLSPARICQWLRRKKARKKPQSRQVRLCSCKF